MKKPFVLIFLTVAFLGCPNDNPVQDNGKVRMLLLSSFEAFGSPSLTGWEHFPSPVDTLTTFSDDVPPGGGKFSVRLSNSGTIQMRARVRLSKTDSLFRYVLSYWAKGYGVAHLTLHSSLLARTQYGPGRLVDDTLWTPFRDTLICGGSDFDTLNVWLYLWPFDTSSVVQFDEVQVLEIAL